MRTTASMIIGVVVMAIGVAAWLYGELHDVDTSILWTVLPVILGALFIGTTMADTKAAAQAAATQTNGTLESRVKAAVAAALADRDAARTRQSVGDISTAATSAETVAGVRITGTDGSSMSGVVEESVPRS